MDLAVVCTLCLTKNVTLFIFVIALSDITRFCQYLAETYHREFETNTCAHCTTHHISFYTLVLYLVKTGSDFYVIQYRYNIKYDVST